MKEMITIRCMNDGGKPYQVQHTERDMPNSETPTEGRTHHGPREQPRGGAAGQNI